MHARIRRDLETVQRLAAQAADGVAPAELGEQLRELRSGSLLWRLEIDCLRYCRFVHLHHHLEDADFFSELRAANPAINPIIDRLQAEHRRVSVDLEAVEAAADALRRDDDQNARQAVVDALGALERNLLAHLAYEEASIETTVRRKWSPLRGTRVY